MSSNHVDFTTLNEYLDQTLPADQQRVVAEHLDTCSDCRAELAELQRLFTNLAAMPEVSLPSDLSVTVVATLAEQSSARVRLPWWLMAVQVVTACLLFVLVWPILLRRLEPLWMVFQSAQVVTWLTRGVGDWTPSVPTVSTIDLWQVIGQMAAWSTIEPTFGLPSLSLIWWGVLLAAVGAVWIVGNRWVLFNHVAESGAKQ